MKIMIVEDNPAMRSFLFDLMKKITPSISLIANGEDAVREYSIQRPDVVLMDIKMPRMDGITATEKIKEIDPYATVLIVTEHDHKIYRDDAKKVGATEYFLKENLIDLFDYVRNTNMNLN